MAKRDGWVRKQIGPGTAVPLLCGRSGEGRGVPQRGVHTGHVAQWTGRGPGSPPPSCPSPFAYATSSYPGLGATLAGSELKRHMLWPQGALGLVGDALLSGKATGQLAQAHRLARPGVGVRPGHRITRGPHAGCPGGSSLSEGSSENLRGSRIKQNTVHSSKHIN